MKKRNEMKTRWLWFIAILAISILISSCTGQTSQTTPSGANGWLSGSTHEKFDTIAKHLRGNDIVMIEVDWRMNELAKAGLLENWARAKYQIKKMHLSMKLGTERRPKREDSYNWFFSTAFPPIEEAIENQDQQQFVERFPIFVQQCNTCHAMEDVPHFIVELPTVFAQVSK